MTSGGVPCAFFDGVLQAALLPAVPVGSHVALSGQAAYTDGSGAIQIGTNANLGTANGPDHGLVNEHLLPEELVASAGHGRGRRHHGRSHRRPQNRRDIHR